MRKTIFLILAATFMFGQANLFSQEAGADERAEPTVWQDIRRTEIITLGSLPFVTILTTLGFSIGSYVSNGFDAARFPNPFSQTSAFTQEEQIGILVTSVSVSVGVGAADLAIRLARRAAARKRAEENRRRSIEVSPVALDSTATRLPPPRSRRGVSESGIALR